MLQATIGDGDAFDALSFFEDLFGSAKVDVSRRDIVDALMIAGIIIVLDEGINLLFEITRQIAIVEQDAVLQSLVPAFDLSLCLRMIRRAADMLHILVLEPGRQITELVKHKRAATQSLQKAVPLWTAAAICF